MLRHWALGFFFPLPIFPNRHYYYYCVGVCILCMCEPCTFNSVAFSCYYYSNPNFSEMTCSLCMVRQCVSSQLFPVRPIGMCGISGYYANVYSVLLLWRIVWCSVFLVWWWCAAHLWCRHSWKMVCNHHYH